MTDTSRAQLWSQRLTGRRLFSWQSRLLTEWLLSGSVPDSLDVPTGLGKTTVISLWLAAFAAGACLPRRLVYVVDRRAVVDQATAEAQRLAGIVGDGSHADELILSLRSQLGLEPGRRLAVSTLRGQFLDNREWLSDPCAPAIVVATVDMTGSRLLFSGYGVSRRMRPVHAGLLAADALIVLDEAHLVPPFEDLLRQVALLRQQSPSEIPPVRIMALSATQRSVGTAVFRLSDEDQLDAEVARRLGATKRLRVHDTVPEKELPELLAGAAWECAAPNLAVVVYCDKRSIAQGVFAALCARIEGAGKPIPIELIVGERRVLERQQLAASEAFRRFMPDRHEDAERPQVPAFLVATSAGEVGVDFDADHMVCDLVAWERMVQRFGRLNRRPRPASDARVDIYPASPERKSDDVAPEARLAMLRAPFEYAEWRRDADGRRNASPGQLQRLSRDVTFHELTNAAQTPVPLRPALSQALLDAWAMTSLREHSGRPDVQSWIRGWVDDDPQTRVAWRKYFPLVGTDAEVAGPERVNLRALSDFFDAAPPHTSEILEAPAFRVAEVLKRRCEALMKRRFVEDLQGSGQHPPVVVVLGSDGSVERYVTAPELASEKADRLVRDFGGRTLLVDSRIGGLDAQGLLDNAADIPALTIDSVASDWPNLPSAVGFRVVDGSVPLSEGWRKEHQWFVPTDSDDEVFSLRVDVWRGERSLRGDPAVAGSAQELDEHQRWVVDEVLRTAERLHLSKEKADVLRLVAEYHDAGKAVPLWQRAMGAPDDGRVYAKTEGRSNPRLLEVGGKTFRHEFGSVGALLKSGAADALSADDGDLAVHLVAAHHGHARPVIAAIDPSMPPSLLAPRAREIALRFHRVHRQWGPWGLAWWEALFRAADARASQRLSDDGEGR